MFDWFRIYSFLALYFDDGSFNITDWLLPSAREISDFNFFIGRSYCAAFPGFYGKQASEIKAKPGTIWSMMSSTDSGLKMSVGLNKAIRSERLQSYTGPRSLTGKFNQCTCKCLPLQREVGIFFQAPVMHAHRVMCSAEKVICLVLKLTVEAIFALLFPMWLLSIRHFLWPRFFVSSCTSRQAIPILTGLAEPSPSLATLSLQQTRAHQCFLGPFQNSSASPSQALLFPRDLWFYQRCWTTLCFLLMETRSLIWTLFTPLFFFFSVSEVV